MLYFQRETRNTPGARGSVLVLVLGTLALMTVLAVVYIGIGKGDRQTASAVERQKINQDVPRQIRDYVSDVIARDALAVFPSYEGVQTGTPTTALRREAWDSPTIYPAYRSSPLIDESGSQNPLQWVADLQSAIPGNRDDVRIDLLRFRPSGNHPTRLDDAALLGQNVVNAIRGGIDFDRRIGSDPWLASSEAVNLDLHLPFNNSDDANLPDAPMHPSGQGGPAQEAWYYNRDILQMSDFAPDGRAVNLFNLRNNFDVPSATGDLEDP